MPKLVSVHSYRGGTGKSNTTANLAALLAERGLRVGLVDTDIQSPGIHILFGLKEEEIAYSLNEYLWGKCEIKQAAVDVTPRLEAPVAGQIFLVPSSLKAMDIVRILREGYDVDRLKEGFRQLVVGLKLDLLLIDTHPGLNEETLLSIALSNALIIILRPDQQDYQGTKVTVAVARKLGVPRLWLLVNRVPSKFNLDDVRQLVASTYSADVLAVLPNADELMELASGGLIVQRYPDHPVTEGLRQAAARLTELL